MLFNTADTGATGAFVAPLGGLPRTSCLRVEKGTFPLFFYINLAFQYRDLSGTV